MSDTPITDSTPFESPLLFVTCRELERELVELRRDACRLDWLLVASDEELNDLIDWTRQSIDIAIRESNQQTEPYYGDPTTEEKEKEL